MWSKIQLCVVGLVVIFVIERIRRYLSTYKLKINGVPLPPGSMGLPFIGEALSLLVTSYALDLHPFFKTRFQRYGPIFRTSIMGQLIIVSADPEINRYVLQQEGNMVELWYFDTFSKIIGLDSETQMNSLGAIHKYTRNTLLKVFGVDNIKHELLPEIDELVHKTLTSWSSNDESVEVIRSLRVVLINFVAKKLISYDAENSSENLSEIFANITDAFVSFPLNIPGTAYRKCVQGKEKVFKMLKEMIKERRGRMSSEDMLDQLSTDLDSQKFLTQNFLLHFIYVVLFASTDTIVAVISLLLKLLQENPLALRELEAEHEAMINKKENPDSPVTWDEYKSMTFTHQVINETLRLTNILPGLLRRVVKDIPIKGVIIPAGWTVMLVTSSQHLSSETFDEPLKFNPWRWKDLDSEVLLKNFMPFGRRARQCPGAEYAKVFMATFIHVLVTKYRWTKVKGGKVSRNPMIGLGKQGMHINVSEK